MPRKCVKKTVKKAAKRTVRKAIQKKELKEKLVGKITHYFGQIKVAVIKADSGFKIGSKLHIKGATSDFKQTIKSMQVEHKAVKTAKKGQVIGLKVSKQVRKRDKVYLSK